MPYYQSPSLSLRTSVMLAAVALVLAACSGSKEASPPAAGSPPKVEVGVVTATAADVGLVAELPGRLEATRTAEVRARTAGILQERMFREGSDVKGGQPLFRIDPAPYQAAVQSAEANVARAEANAIQARAMAQRYEPLVGANAISKQEYENAVASHKVADAEVAATRAALVTSRINLGYATVAAPISGRIGRALVTEGALVGQNEATPLAVIQQIDPMYVNFTQSASEVLKLRRAVEGGELKRSNSGSVRIVLEDGTEYGHPAKLLFSDLTVDATTGQVALRAEVPNPKGLLLPGLYVRVRLEQAQATDAITLPQQAVTRGPQGDSVLVLADGKISPRSIRVGGLREGQSIVLEGLKPGEQVVVDGVQRAQMMPGATIVGTPWKAVAAMGATPGVPAPSTPTSR